jgi:hypothetical protein
MKNYKKSNKRKNRTRTRSKAGLALLTIVVMAIIAFSNILTNKTEAASTDIYDLILFWGQSNMVGSADGHGESRQGTSDASRTVFSEKTGIKKEIVEGIKSRYKVDTGIPDGWAYEYIHDPNVYARDNYGIAAWQSVTGDNNTNWNDSHLKPVGFDHIYGETIKAVKTNDEYLIGGTTKASKNYDTYASGATNMVPQFCKTYYEETGHKVIAVVCAYGGKGIDEFTPLNKNSQENGTYVVMSRKMWAAAGYIQDHRPDIKLGKFYAVSMQGENVTDVDNYEHYYREVVKGLNRDCAISKHVLCETGGTLPRGNTDYANTSEASFDDVMKMHQAQEKLCDDYSDTILGSNYGYNSYVPMNAQDYAKCTTAVCYKPGTSTKWSFDQAVKHASLRMDYDYGYYSNSATGDLVRNSSMDRPDANTNWFNGIHYTSASLCQIGLEAASSLAKTITSANLKLSPKSGTCKVGETKTFTISRDVTAGTLGCESADTSIATATLSGNTVTVTAKKVGVVNIWVGSQPTAEVKGESDYYQLTVEPASNPVTVSAATGLVYGGGAKSLVTVSNQQGKMYYSKTTELTSSNYQTDGSTSSPSEINAGTYIVYWYTPGNSTYGEKKGSVWVTISQQALDVPVIETPEFTYDGTQKSPTISGYSESTMNQTGITAGTQVKVYSVYWTLKDPSNYKWRDGTTGQKVATWSIIQSGALAVDARNWYGTYDGTYHSISVTWPAHSDATIKYGKTEGIYDSVAPHGYKNAGNYREYYQVSKPGYTTVEGYKWVTISPAPLEFELADFNGDALTSVDGQMTVGQTMTIRVKAMSDYDNPSYITVEGTTSNSNVSLVKYDGEYMNSYETDYCFDVLANNPGTVTITFKHNEGENFQAQTATFQITVKNNTLSVTSSGYEGTYDGAEHSISVECNGATITYGTTEGTYSATKPTFKDAGTYTVYYKVSKSGYDDVTGSKTVKINKKALTVAANAQSKVYGDAVPSLTYTYSGNVSNQTPNFTGTLKTTATATSGVGQYDITNNNLALADNGAFKANNYSLSVTGAKLTVTAKSLSSTTLTLNPTNYTYDGSAKTPETIVKDGNTTLTKNTDYTVAYSNNTNVGTGTATVTGKGNYTGSKSATFTIGARSLSDATLTLNPTSYTYDGTAKTPATTVKYGDTTLTKDTDYTVAYSNNTNVGTGTVTIT